MWVGIEAPHNTGWAKSGGEYGGINKLEAKAPKEKREYNKIQNNKWIRRLLFPGGSKTVR